jgi:hypothetical protein
MREASPTSGQRQVRRKKLSAERVSERARARRKRLAASAALWVLLDRLASQFTNADPYHLDPGSGAMVLWGRSGKFVTERRHARLQRSQVGIVEG